MKATILVASTGILVSTLAYSQGTTGPKTQKEKVSYSIGLDIGKNMKRQMIEVDVPQLTRGLQDGLADTKPALTDKEMEEVMTTFRSEIMKKMEENRRKLAEKNLKDGGAFLAENKKKPGVITLPSGLQYKILKEGAGKSPKATDTVVTHYRGTLLDGKEFDSSYKRGEPLTFAVKGVIPGWVEALQLMKPGAKWQLFIPGNLAYGENGAGQDIGPNATLMFEVELLKVK